MSSVWTGPYGSKAGRLHNSDSKDEMKSLTEQVSRRGNILRIFAAGFPTDEIKIDVGVVREQRDVQELSFRDCNIFPYERYVRERGVGRDV